jgi:hypothetical protein
VAVARQPAFDLAIMVNWLHNLTPDQIQAGLLSIKTPIRYFLVDQILTDLGPTRHQHDFDAIFGGQYKKINVFDDKGENARRLLLYERR